MDAVARFEGVSKRFGNTVRISYMKMKKLVNQPVSTRYLFEPWDDEGQ